MFVKNKINLNYGWIVLCMGTLAVFGALGLARFGYSTVLPALQIDLSLNNEQAGWLATSNLAGYLAFSFIGGMLAGRYGARLIASLGLVLASIAMIFTGMAQNFTSLIIWRGLTGVGSGAANIAVMGLWAAWFAKKKRGLASGIAVSGSSLALILTGLLIPPIIATYGDSSWRLCWFIFGGVTSLLAVSTYIILRNNPSDIGLKPVGTDTDDQPVSNQIKKESSQKRIYSSFQVWQLGLVYITYGFSYIIYLTFFIKHLTTSGGYSGTAAGYLFMTMGWASLCCGLLWGSFSDRFGRKMALVILFLIHTLAFSLFAFGNNSFYFIVSVILFGLSAWSVPALMAAICGDLFTPKLAPAALGFITLFFGVGQAVGPVIAGRIADNYGSFSPAIWLAAVVAFFGGIGSLFLKEKSSEGRTVYGNCQKNNTKR